jgi:choline kinase
MSPASRISAPSTLSQELATLLAADDLETADPEIAHLAALEGWLSDDPASYVDWITRLGRERLRTDESAASLTAAVLSLSGEFRAGRIGAFACGEALQVCLADLVLLEELAGTDVPSSALTTLRRRLADASVDLVRRIVRNLALRRGGPDADPAARERGQPVPLSEHAQWPRIERAQFDRGQPVLLIPTAGRGTRLRSTIPKGLVPVGGLPMIEYAIRAAAEAGVQQRIFVLKYGADVQRDYLERRGHVVIQPAADGNGHSAYAGLTALSEWHAPVLIAYSDCPFLDADTFRRLVGRPMEKDEALRLSVYSPARESAGRIVRAADGEIERIDQPRLTKVSHAEADGGLYEVSVPSFYHELGRITNENARGEYQLTDVVSRLRASGWRIGAAPGPAEDFQSVDTPADLILARLRTATGTRTPGELVDALAGPGGLALLAPYGFRLPGDAGSIPEGKARARERAAMAVSSARALIGPLLELGD